MCQSVKFSVYNPEGRLVQTVGTAMGAAEGASAGSAPVALAPRLDSLDGKLVYLVDTGFGGSYRFMQQLQHWMGEHLPSVTTIRKRKPGGPFSDDGDALWDEIKSKGGDAVILGVGG